MIDTNNIYTTSFNSYLSPGYFIYKLRTINLNTCEVQLHNCRILLINILINQVIAEYWL